MSGTTRAPETGLAQLVAVPAAIDSAEPLLWPLQDRLVFERTEQLVSEMFGAPPNNREMSVEACPVSSVKMQELSGGKPPTTVEDAVTLIDERPSTDTNAGSTAADTLPAWVSLPDSEKFGVPTVE